jgi:hypothetical protein
MVISVLEGTLALLRAMLMMAKNGICVEFALPANVQGRSVYDSRSGVLGFPYPSRKLRARKLRCTYVRCSKKCYTTHKSYILT